MQQFPLHIHTAYMHIHTVIHDIVPSNFTESGYVQVIYNDYKCKNKQLTKTDDMQNNIAIS